VSLIGSFTRPFADSQQAEIVLQWLEEFPGHVEGSEVQGKLE
jgi:hypothetical protein